MTTADPSTLAEQTFSGLETAWNAADGTAFGAAFADDADFVDIRGGHHRGRAAVAAGHQALFDSLYAGSAIRYEVHSTRLLTPECVVAVADATLDTPAGPAAGVHRSRLTAVVTAKGGDTWTIAAFHHSLVQAHV
jgi:uncharacterized protein (TIGR02246 family)